MLATVEGSKSSFSLATVKGKKSDFSLATVEGRKSGFSLAMVRERKNKNKTQVELFSRGIPGRIRAGTEISIQITTIYRPEAARGIRKSSIHGIASTL